MKKVMATIMIVLFLVGILGITAPAEAAPPTWHWYKFGMMWDQDPSLTPGSKDLALVTEEAGWGGVYRYLPEGTKIDDIVALSYWFYVDEGDCGGGAPRLSLGIDLYGDGGLDVVYHNYAGDPPSFTDCLQDTWLFENATDEEYDWSTPGWPLKNWTQVKGLLNAYSGHQILWVLWVVDNYWWTEPGLIWVDDLTIHDSTLGEPRDQSRL